MCQGLECIVVTTRFVEWSYWNISNHALFARSPYPFCSPVAGWRGELEAQRVNFASWEQFTGNGNKTLRVAATMLMKVFTRKAPNVETGYVQTGNGQTVNAQTGNVQTCHSAWLKKPFPFPPTVLWGCVAQPLLATSNIHPALARTRARYWFYF